jgi:hypothetical protein
MMDMITLVALALPLALIGAAQAFGLRLVAEDRPGFDERKPLS